MRRRSAALAALAALAAFAPALARAQTPPAFSTVLQTFAVAGCSQSGFAQVCSYGTGMFGALTTPATYGLRLDVRTLVVRQNPLETILSLNLQPHTFGQFTSAPLNGSCGALRQSGAVCAGVLDFFQISNAGGIDGESVSTAFLALPVGGTSVLQFGGDPATFRLAGLSLVYDGAGRVNPSPPFTESITVVVPVSVTPEPATLALAGAGVALLGGWARRRTA